LPKESSAGRSHAGSIPRAVREDKSARLILSPRERELDYQLKC
jgi:hypothetical protein